MKAIVIPKHGPPKVFEEREVEDRRLKPTDLRIRVEAAGVNFADLMGRVGLYPDAPPLPYAPGYEVAGVVEEAGEMNTHWKYDIRDTGGFIQTKNPRPDGRGSFVWWS